jgi:hypothetical protein
MLYVWATSVLVRPQATAFADAAGAVRQLVQGWSAQLWYTPVGLSGQLHDVRLVGLGAQ